MKDGSEYVAYRDTMLGTVQNSSTVLNINGNWYEQKGTSLQKKTPMMTSNPYPDSNCSIL